MKIETITVGPFQSNCLMVWNPTTMEGLLADTGDSPDRILAAVKEHGVKIKAILLTHGHLDHVSAAGAVAAELDAPIYLHAEDVPLLANVPQQCRLFGLPPVESPSVDHELTDGQALNIGGLEVVPMHTPGHSPGHTCFLVRQGDEQALLAGDLIFAGSIGRTDLWGGDNGAMMRSLERLKDLNEDLAVYPGHGPSTTIGREKKSNPYLNGMFFL